MLSSGCHVVMVAVGGRWWMGRCKVHGCDQGIQSHVKYAWGRHCKYCNESRRNALTNKLFLNTLSMFLLVTGQLPLSRR